MLFVTGCGVGFGPGEEEGSAEITVTRDYGSEVLLSETTNGLTESSTAMRLLDASADIETRYGGGFVQSIDGISASAGGRSSDWFYFVNGIAADRGAAEFVIRPGDRMWWDYRDWTDAMEVDAVVGGYPAPMVGGYDGRQWPVRLECLPAAGSACDVAEAKLEESGVELANLEEDENSLRMLVGPWPAMRSDQDAFRLDSGPGASGVFALFETSPEGPRLVGLDQRAEPARDFGTEAGLIAAMRRGDDPPVWLVTGGDANGTELAAAALDAGDLRNRYAAAVTGRAVASLPVDSTDVVGVPE